MLVAYEEFQQFSDIKPYFAEARKLREVDDQDVKRERLERIVHEADFALQCHLFSCDVVGEAAAQAQGYLRFWLYDAADVFVPTKTLRAWIEK